MEKPNQIKLPSPQERLELILLAMGRTRPVTELCRQAGVSRELLYRWMRLVRQAGLKALEAKAPGPKTSSGRPPEKELANLRERVKRLEKESKKLRKERDRFKRITELAQRIIRRNAWGPFPQPEASKKNGGRTQKRGSFTRPSGEMKAAAEDGPKSSPGSGESAGAPTGGG